jgi:putative endonuclease
MSILDRLRKKFTKPSQLSNTQRIGDAAEERALQFLKTQGLTLLQRNFRCRGGEIDLIMQEQATLVFVEVRQRSSRSHGGALASVTPAKQKRLLIAAQLYLQRYQSVPACRFDVVAYDGLQRQWVKNAIEALA